MDKIKLGELIKIENGRNYETLNDKAGYPVYGSGGFMGFTDNFLFDSKSILLPRKGTLNNIQFVNGKFWTVDTTYWTNIDQEKVDPYFLYYYLRTLDISKLYTGSTLPSMTKIAYESIDLEIPSLASQKKVSKLLSQLDNKIELNHKMNTELEQLARQIYEYWFLQFDFPDENGNPYKSSGGKMVYNFETKREIPLGWEMRTLKEVAEMYQPEIISAKKFMNKGKYTVYGANGVIGFYDKYNHEYPEVLITCRGATCGNIHYSAPKSWITGNAMVIHPNAKFENKLSKEYLKLHFEQSQIAKTIISGSAQPQITRANLEMLKILVVKESILQKFDTFIKPIFKKIQKNNEESQDLVKQRDYLLPLLMNGQIKVDNI